MKEKTPCQCRVDRGVSVKWCRNRVVSDAVKVLLQARVLKHRVIHSRHASTCDIGTDVQPLQGRHLAELSAQQLRIALGRVRTVVLEAVEVLVSFTAHLASIGLLLLHSHSAGVWYRCERVDDGESAVLILLELLILVTVLGID